MLAIAVIGGLYRLEGAWIGAFIYVVLNNYLQTISFIGPRFDTVIGIIFLVIVLVSPAGLMGIWERALGRAPKSRPRGRRHAPSEHDTGERRLVTRIGVSASVAARCVPDEGSDRAASNERESDDGEFRTGKRKLVLPLAGAGARGRRA